jgi:hypothetical protein
MPERVGAWSVAAAAAGVALAPLVVEAQATADQQRDAAVGTSISYVFATDLGSGVYDLDGRTLQIYRLTYTRPWREAGAGKIGVRFDIPLTVGFFDFRPVDVLSNGLPTRVDSFSAVPGVELDYLLPQDWHLVPYARAGFSVASSSVDGWLFGTGVRLERRSDFHGWDHLTSSELAIAAANYRDDVPSDRFVRLRQGFDFTRGLPWKIRDRALELGLYSVLDVIVDPPEDPLTEGRRSRIQGEFGFTLATRPRYRIWRFDAPRLGFGYRFAGELSAWRFVIGTPF